MSMTPSIRIASALLLAAIARATFAQPHDFGERCKQLAEKVTVTGVFLDAPITWDTTKRIEELRRISKEGSANHSVLGMTAAQPTAKMNVTHWSATDDHGRTCIAGSVVLTLGFSEMRVYLASSLTNNCRRRIVEEHELKHVRIWRNHFRAGAKMAETAIRNQLALPIFTDSSADAEAALRQHVNDVIAPIVAQITAVADTAQREIDTPESYRLEGERYRACP